VITAVSPAAAGLYIRYDCLDPGMVTELDIIGGYGAATGTYKGMELIEQIYPRLGLVPGQILAPGWSHRPLVAAVMAAKTTVNGSFKCTALADIDSGAAATYDEVGAWKNANGYSHANLIACWPKVTAGGQAFYLSALWAALTAYVDATHEGIPYKSPSNEPMRITGTVNDAGTEVYLDQLQGNYLNGLGICTVLNLNGWRSWGNNTTIYPAVTDVKDRFIPVRRMFNWWGNTFILTYFQKVDSPANRRLIEILIDSENIRANGFQARGIIASGKMSFNAEENPITDLLDGKLRFSQKLAFFTPAETITNMLEFDPYALRDALMEGDV
jgi:phage tail sheath protein FI